MVWETLCFETGLLVDVALATLSGLAGLTFQGMIYLSPPLGTGIVLHCCLGAEEQIQVFVLGRCFSNDATFPTTSLGFLMTCFRGLHTVLFSKAVISLQ